MSVELFISCRRRINDGPQSQKYRMFQNTLKDIFYIFTELEIKHDYLERWISQDCKCVIKYCINIDWIFIFNPSVKHLVLKVRGEDFLPGWGTSERNLSSWSLWTPEGCSRIAPGGRPAWFPPRSQTSDDGGLGSNDPHEVCTHTEIRLDGQCWQDDELLRIASNCHKVEGDTCSSSDKPNKLSHITYFCDIIRQRFTATGVKNQSESEMTSKPNKPNINSLIWLLCIDVHKHNK